MIDEDRLATKLLAIGTEKAELRIQLAEVQNQCVELGVDNGRNWSRLSASGTWRAEAGRFGRGA